MFHSLLDRNVYFAPSGYETLFPSLAHTDAEIDETIAAVAAIALKLASYLLRSSRFCRTRSM